MKKNKLYSIFLLIFSFVSLCSFFIVPTLSKYVFEANAPFESKPNVDYTVNEVFEVRTQEELFSAINQGYSYIQLSKDIENPLIITQDAKNLNSDLILDLNGIEIQRNGYDPILNIGSGVRLTVTDTSDEQTGGLYNPVGSVFNIDGGTLTVSIGTFESGPRYSEYYSYNSSILSSTNATTKRTIVEPSPQEVNLSLHGNEETRVLAPIIKSYPTTTGEIVYNHGNLYFDEQVSKGDFTISADTYCYYRTSEDHSSGVNDPSKADWYYTYYVKKDGHEYYAPELSSDDVQEDYVFVTIYGYEKTIENASLQTVVSDYYAAIQMKSGLLEVEKGEFFSYFGVNTTACINASGGTLSVKQGKFSSRIPNADIISENTVLVKEDDSEAFKTEYFDNFIWKDLILSKSGESYCILNSGDADILIETGDFYSSNNNIISMNGGNLTIGDGQFYKKHTREFERISTASSAIYMMNGNLSIQNADCDIQGNRTIGIFMQDGYLNIENSSFSLVGSYTFGIYSTVKGDDNFNIIDTFITQSNGNSQVGIYAEGGKVHLSSSLKNPKISLDGSSSAGIYVLHGGSVVLDNYSIEIQGENSSGIYSKGGTVQIQNSSIVMESNVGCYGIYADTEETSSTVDIVVENSGIYVGYNDSTAKKANTVVNPSIGIALLTNQIDNTISMVDTTIESYEIGVSLSGGSLYFDGNGHILTKMASAVEISDGKLVFKNTSTYDLTSFNTNTTSAENTYDLLIPSFENGTVTTKKYINTDGIYVQGGSVIFNGNVNITHTGLQNDTDYTNYAGLEITSYAVRVIGGDVTIIRGNITANIGGGVYCSGGDIILGDIRSTEDDIIVQTIGEKYGSSYDAIGSFVSDGWQTYKSLTGGHAIELNGGNISVNNGTFTANYGNGVLAKGNGEINIRSGIFNGWMGTGNNALIGKSGPSAFYGLKVVGGAIVNIYGGTFDGGNGGAFITGITDITLVSGKITAINGTQAYVYVYAGTFGHEGTSLKDGFNVYDMSTVILGASSEQSNWSTDDYNAAIKIYASNAFIAANNITNGTLYKPSYIDIYYGSYIASSATGDALYNMSATITVYNRNMNYTVFSPSSTTGKFTDVKNTAPVFYS